MTNQPKLTGKGGPGRGQGRKPKGGKGGEVGVMISIRLTPQIAGWLRDQPRGQRTQIIEEALIEKYGPGITVSTGQSPAK